MCSGLYLKCPWCIKWDCSSCQQVSNQPSRWAANASGATGYSNSHWVRTTMIEVHANLAGAEIAAMVVWPRRRSPPGGLLSSTPRHSMQQPPGPNHLPLSKIHIRKLEEKSFCHFLSCCRMPKWLRVKAPLFERYTTMNITRCLRGFSEASFWKICNSPQ